MNGSVQTYLVQRSLLLSVRCDKLKYVTPIQIKRHTGPIYHEQEQTVRSDCVLCGRMYWLRRQQFLLLSCLLAMLTLCLLIDDQLLVEYVTCSLNYTQLQQQYHTCIALHCHVNIHVILNSLRSGLSPLQERREQLSSLSTITVVLTSNKNYIEDRLTLYA